MSDKALTIVDLFSGCGGFSLGARLAGFKPVLAVDNDKILSSSYVRNFPDANLLIRNVADLTAEEIFATAACTSISGLIGGPPCQGFSDMGKRDAQDPRNSLLGHFFRLVREIKPSFFIVENVPGLKAERNRDILVAAKESVRDIYNGLITIDVDAADYGAATSRKRVLIVGFRERQQSVSFCEHLNRRKGKATATVRDAISDLPAPSFSEEKDFFYSRYPEAQKVSPYARRARRAEFDCALGDPEALRRLREDGEITGATATKHTATVATRYASVEGGKRDKVSKSYKLMWDAQCTTLRAGTGPEKGSFNSVRPLHPDEGRVITVREAARIQGFPDWFLFHPTKWHSFRMIGNSVSPYVSYNVLRAVRKAMRG